MIGGAGHELVQESRIDEVRVCRDQVRGIGRNGIRIHDRLAGSGSRNYLL